MWELWIADRLADGRLGVIGKPHHCMVDGLAAVELATLLLDPAPDPPDPEPDAWRPAPPPGALSLLDRSFDELLSWPRARRTRKQRLTVAGTIPNVNVAFESRITRA